MTIPDNRMRFSAPKIDFENDVGLTGQAHDSYPEPGQPRWDWMRMSLIGLLAQQSSFDEPTQKRPGTPWFNLNTNILKLWNGAQWIKYGDVIEVSNNLTLTQFYESIKDQLVEFLVSQEDIQYAVDLIINAALSEYITPLTVVEVDGVPSVDDVGTLIFPNGSLTQTGTGKVRVRFPAPGGDDGTLLFRNGLTWRPQAPGPNWAEQAFGASNILCQLFDDTAVEEALAEDFIAEGGGDITVRVNYLNVAATPGDVIFKVQFGYANNGAAAFSSEILTYTLPVDNTGSLVRADLGISALFADAINDNSLVQLKIWRESGDGDDTMVGDFYLVDVTPFLGLFVPS